jgi:hypothetical protein
MLLKFQRNYELEVVGNDGNLYVFTYPLTLEFMVKRNVLASANTGNFRIYNLGQQHRNVIYKDQFSPNLSFRSLIVKAGYGVNQAISLPIIFQGNVMQAQSYRQEKSVNFITEIDGYDYAWVMTNASSNRNYPSGTVLQSQIIKDLIGDLTKTVPTDPTNKGASLGVGAISPQYDVTYNQNVAIVGNTWDNLQKITNNQAYIDNGNVYCLFENDVFNGDLTIIDSQTGLLGTPKKQDRMIIVEMLFEPRLQVGQQVQIISSSLAQYPNNNNGYFKVVGIEHRGTISGAVSGECKTIVSCLLPFESINVLNANT